MEVLIKPLAQCPACVSAQRKVSTSPPEGIKLPEGKAGFTWSS